MQPSKLHYLRKPPWRSRGGSKTRQWKVTFGNVTTWGEKTNKYMEDTDGQICLMAETHVPASGIEAAVAAARQKGWSSIVEGDEGSYLYER